MNNIFEEVLFPLIERLLKPEVFGRDPVGMGETRVAVARVLCKVFLHFLVQVKGWEGMVGVWGRVLELGERLMLAGSGGVGAGGAGGNSGMVCLPFSNSSIFFCFTTITFRSHHILPPPHSKPISNNEQEEELSESLKNILYFMKSDNYLVPPSSSGTSQAPNEIWTQTWNRVDRFLPGMRAEIFPPETPTKPSPKQAEDEGTKEQVAEGAGAGAEVKGEAEKEKGTMGKEGE